MLIDAIASAPPNCWITPIVLVVARPVLFNDRMRREAFEVSWSPPNGENTAHGKGFYDLATFRHIGWELFGNGFAEIIRTGGVWQSPCS